LLWETRPLVPFRRTLLKMKLLLVLWVVA